MCGRFSLKGSVEEIERFFGLADVDDFPPRYNIAPTQPILMIIADPQAEGSNRPRRRAVLVRWGLVPSWAKDPASLPLLFNARCETAAEKNAFRGAMRHRRTLVPASGFYEWRHEGKKKAEPYWVRPRAGGLIAFAGLMETWLGADGSEIDTGTILTTDANATLAPIHDRMPVIIAPQDFERWLDCRGHEPREVADLLKPADPGLLEAIPVSDKVNRVANTGPEIQEPVAGTPPSPKKGPSGGDGGQMAMF
jgi:putative SOS response-associated peptidase YedK